jgi:hypothetical protein
MTPGFLDYMLVGRLGALNRRLFGLYFRRVRVCRVIHEPDAEELRRCRSDVCDCRLLEKACSHRLDLCWKIDGEPRDPQPADDLPAISQAAHLAGLVRMRVETLGTRIEYCHCCACCCYALRVARKMGPGHILPSGHYPAAGADCEGCGSCRKACPLGARDGATTDLDRCLGCGLCALACPLGNLSMRPWREGDPCRHREDRESALRNHLLLARLIGVFLTIWVCAAHQLYHRHAHRDGRPG